MKYYSIFLSILLVFSLLGSIRFLDDNDFISEDIIVHANLKNRGSDTIYNTKVKFLVLDDVEIRGASSSTHLDSGDKTSKIAYTDNNLQPGEYWVRIYAYGDDGKRSIKHRPIIIQ